MTFIVYLQFLNFWNFLVQNFINQF